MTKVYYIENAQSGGYYDSNLREFVADIKLATDYPTSEEATARVNKFTEGFFIVKPVFKK